MPTSRKRKGRGGNYRITARAIELYREAKATTDQRRLFELARELHDELGLPITEHCPLWPAEESFTLIAPPVDFDSERSAEQARQIRGEIETFINER